MKELPWLRVANAASKIPTPFFVFWSEPFREAVANLQRVMSNATPHKTRQWYSYKSQPVPHMAKLARQYDMGCEVVSRYELAAALNLNFPTSNILVNGVAKQCWLRKDLCGINVVFDSLNEIVHFAETAKEQRWRSGVRLSVTGQVDPDAPHYPAQFGIEKSEFKVAVDAFARVNLPLEILHFHLRSDVPSAASYIEAISELGEVARDCDVDPRVIDIGGGLSDRKTVLGMKDVGFPPEQFGRVAQAIFQEFPRASELWLENGRHLLGPSGALVVTICDEKWVRGIRFLICDGGRTNQALESDWEFHPVLLLPNAQFTEPVETVICGPNCMAFDWIHRGAFTRHAKVGDRLIYLGAGAYHIPLETRFSRGLCQVIWTDDGERFREIRSAETEMDWLSVWRD